MVGALVRTTVMALLEVTLMRHTNRMMVLVLALALLGCAKEDSNKNGAVLGGRDTSGVVVCMERELKARLSPSDWENRGMTGMAETESFDFMKRLFPALMRARGVCGIPDENPFGSESMSQCVSTVTSRRDTSPSEVRSLCLCAEKELKAHVSVADWERSSLLDMNDNDMGEYITHMMRVMYDAVQVCMKKK